jgi:hypothetical protein
MISDKNMLLCCITTLGAEADLGIFRSLGAPQGNKKIRGQIEASYEPNCIFTIVLIQKHEFTTQSSFRKKKQSESIQKCFRAKTRTKFKALMSLTWNF